MSSSELAPEPHPVSRRNVTRVMGLVLLALLPGVLVQIWLQGADRVWQLLIAVGFGIAIETVMLGLRGQSIRPFLSDLSAPLAAVLLALLLPVATPWWVLGVGVLAAIAVAKHLFGGLGSNLFNPAMVGYAVLLICFPGHFEHSAASASIAVPGTLLPAMFALGGAFLIWKRIIPAYTPASFMLGALVAVLVTRVASSAAIALAFQDLFSSALMLAAFFIVTDPVTGCLAARGRIFFAAGTGILAVLLTHAGSAADGLPFAVLLMNCVAPWLDQHTRPMRKSASALP